MRIFDKMSPSGDVVSGNWWNNPVKISYKTMPCACKYKSAFTKLEIQKHS